jgi:hypothetical protein
MSNYHALARHPITGEIRVADWLDDSFGHHIYGVRFPGDETIYRSTQCNEVSLHEAGVEIERLREVVLLGVNARKCQVIYFKTRNRDALLVSKNAERAFDDAARAALAGEKTDD